MNKKLTAALLIAAAVLTNAAFTVLGTVFNYPDILGEPVEDILAAFRAHQTAVVGWFTVMALSAALFTPIAIGVGRLSTHRAMRIAVPVGIAASASRSSGSPLAAPGPRLRRRRGQRRPGASRPRPGDSFVLAHRLLGTIVGETLGYSLTAAWTVLVLIAVGGWIARRWFTALGVVSAVLILGGVLVPLQLPLVEDRQLHRLHPVERLAGDLRHPDPPPRPVSRCRGPTHAGDYHRAGALMIGAPVRRRDTFFGSWLIWTAGFLAFPIAGLAGRAVAGRVDDPVAALLAGLVTGAVVGAGQWLVSRGRLRPVPWILATALGMGGGLLLGATVVGFKTSLADVAVMAAAHRPGARRGPDSGAAGSDPTTLVVGAGHAVPVGARLGRHHPGRDSRRGAVHHLRRQRCRHLLRPVRVCCCTRCCPWATAWRPAPLAPTPRS